jgi:hypothetical protein
MTAQSHSKKYPKARPSTLAYLEKRDAMTRLLMAPKKTAWQKLKGWLRNGV